MILGLVLAVPLQVFDLTTDDGGFTSAGSTQQWQWGAASTGPGGERGAVWATELHRTYLNDTVDTLGFPVVSLGGAARPVLVVVHWYEMYPGDYGVVQIDDGGGWRDLQPFYGYPLADGFSGSSGGWRRTTFDLSGYGSDPRLRLKFAADESVAADGWYVEQVEIHDGDVTPPQFTAVSAPTDTQDLDGPYVITAAVRDDVSVLTVVAEVSIDGGPVEQVPLSWGSGETWSASLSGSLAPGTEVSWSLVATDGLQDTRWPSVGDHQFRVFLAAPTNLAGPEGRVVATHAPLDWTPPASPHRVDHYRVYEAGVDAPTEVDGAPAFVPLGPGSTHVVEVAAVYDVGEGDRSDPVVIEAEVPSIAPLEPAVLLRGDRRRLELRGDHLYLLQDSTVASLGAGVEVEAFDVVDVTRASLAVRVDADAGVGPRTLILDGPHGTFAFADALEIRAASTGARIVTVEPEAVVQGRLATVAVTASAAFAGPVEVWAGDGLVLASEVVVDGNVAMFDLVAEVDAPPGVRTLILDDGVRLWSAEFSVEEYLPPIQRSCACATGGGLVPGLTWLLVPWLWRRRRAAAADQSAAIPAT